MEFFFTISILHMIPFSSYRVYIVLLDIAYDKEASSSSLVTPGHGRMVREGGTNGTLCTSTTHCIAMGVDTSFGTV